MAKRKSNPMSDTKPINTKDKMSVESNAKTGKLVKHKRLDGTKSKGKPTNTCPGCKGSSR